MITKNIIISIFFGIVLLLFQLLILNQIDFNGYLNPYIYPILIILLPLNINKSLLLTFAFLLGLGVDFYEFTGGLNALSCLIVAALKNQIMSIVSGKEIDKNKTSNFFKLSNTKKMVVLGFLFFIFHLIMYSLEAFSFSTFINVILSIVFSTIFNVIFSFIIIGFIKFNNKKKLK